MAAGSDGAGCALRARLVTSHRQELDEHRMQVLVAEGTAYRSSVNCHCLTRMNTDELPDLHGYYLVQARAHRIHRCAASKSEILLS
jgi:hypothetical protein